MNEYVLNLTLDINCQKSVTRLFMGQYDIGRKADVTVTADGEPYTCKNCMVVCQGVRGNRTHFTFDCEVNSAGHIIATFDEILKSSGIAFAKFVISDSKHSYSTQNFIIDCDHALLGDITNNDDYITLSKLIERVHALNASGAVLVDTELLPDSSNPVANKVLYSALNGKQQAQYITETITAVEDLVALNDVNAVYSGVMSGFSSTFGQNTDSAYIGFRMWFVQHSPKQAISFDRIILLQDGSIWSAGSVSSTAFKQIAYSKNQVDTALAGKAYKSTTLAGYGINDSYTKIEVDTALKEKQNVQYLNATVTTINDFVAYNQTNTIYTGRMQGFSTKFGELSDTAVKGFRMWFVLSGTDNPTWYRIVLFDDGTLWTALRSSMNFTQKSYTKLQIDKRLAEKADLDAYENAIELSTVSSAEQLNNYIDTNKTYVFNAVPPFASKLSITTGGELCVLNIYRYYDSNDYIQIIRTARYINKVFSRTYNQTTDTWSEFTDITVPDNYIIETGSGEFTTTSARISSADFEYQKIGDYVTVNVFISFAESSMGATTSIQLNGLPFANKHKGVIRKLIATSAKTNLIAAVGTNSTVNILTSAAVNFSADETSGFSITYKIN